MNFGVPIFPQAEELDLVGPWEMLAMWSKFAGGPKTCLIVAQTLEPATCANAKNWKPPGPPVPCSKKARLPSHWQSWYFPIRARVEK